MDGQRPAPLPRVIHGARPSDREFLELGFKYDNLLMEESAQILEIETFIPMLLQQAQVCAHATHAWGQAKELLADVCHGVPP